MRVLETPAYPDPVPASIAHAVRELFTRRLGSAEEFGTRTIDRLDPVRDLNFGHFRARAEAFSVDAWPEGQ
jgi:hypothetical protein